MDYRDRCLERYRPNQPDHKLAPPLPPGTNPVN